MKPLISAPFFTVAICAAISIPCVQGALFSDDFESYTADTALNTSGPWTAVSGGAAYYQVRDEATSTPFGTPNQYLDFDDSSTSASVRLQSADIAAASGAVTTFSFDFFEPSSVTGGGLILGYANQGQDHNGGGIRLSVNIDDGTITGMTAAGAGTNTYSLDTGYRLYLIFNDTGSTVNYTGGSVGSETADIWIQPIGGSAVFAGTSGVTANGQTPAYRVGFRSFSTNLQQALFDNVALYEGVLLPGHAPSIVTTSPADDDTGVPGATDLVATFDKPVVPGSGNITLKRTSDDVTVDTFDVTNPAEVSFSGSTVTFSVTGLSDNTGYYVLIDAGAIEDEIGEAFPEISLKTEWDFVTAADASPPVIVTRSPVDDATAVTLGTNLVLTFDETVVEATGNITITNLTESNTFATIDVTDLSQVQVSGSTLTINPAADFVEGRSYAVEIDAGSVTDSIGNPFAGISGTTDWNFATIPDTTDPALVSTNPADDSEGVAFSANLVATFDELVQAGTGDITILNLTTSTTFATIAVTDGSQVSFSGNTMTINPATNLDPGQYAIQIDAGAVTDFSSNSWAGIVSPDVTSWNFTTYLLNSKDHIIGERQAGASPSDYYPNSGSNLIGTGGAGGAIDHRNVVLGFVLPTLPVGQTAGSVDFEFEITQARDTTGAANLPDLQVYLLDTADPDATGDTFFFEGASDPSPNAKLVTTTSVTISGTGDNNFADDSEDRVVTLTGDALALIQSFYGGDHIPEQPEAFFRFNLGEDTLITTYRRYRIDLADNESDLQIIGVPATPPVLASTVPADDATTVSQGTNLVATFDQPIVAGSGNIVIKNVTDSTTFDTIPVGDAQVSISGAVLKIDLTTDLDPNKEYAIQLDVGVIEDLTGQGNAAIADDTTWSFQTGFSGAQASVDSIRGRAESASLDYFVDSSAGGRVGIGGPSGDRQDFNIVLGFTLPTLPVGETISGANFDFEIEQSQDNGSDPALHVYLLDTADPDTSGITFFYHGASDPNTDVEFVGSTNLPATGNVSYADDEQDQTLAITGDALALLESYYGGDHIPEQTEVFFRFNLDQLLGGETINNFERYFLDTASAESSLTIASASTGNPYDTWAGGTFTNPFVDTAQGSNPDGDSFGNLLEFAFGTDPTVSDITDLDISALTNGRPIVQAEFSPTLTFNAVFVRRKDYGTSGSVDYTVQFSADLDPFVDDATVPTVIGDSSEDPTHYEIVSVPYPFFMDGGPDDGKKVRFFRVKVDPVP